MSQDDRNIAAKENKHGVFTMLENEDIKIKIAIK